MSRGPPYPLVAVAFSACLMLLGPKTHIGFQTLVAFGVFQLSIHFETDKFGKDEKAEIPTTMVKFDVFRPQS